VKHPQPYVQYVQWSFPGDTTRFVMSDGAWADLDNAGTIVAGSEFLTTRRFHAKLSPTIDMLVPCRDCGMSCPAPGDWCPRCTRRYQEREARRLANEARWEKERLKQAVHQREAMRHRANTRAREEIWGVRAALERRCALPFHVFEGLLEGERLFAFDFFGKGDWGDPTRGS